MPKQKSYAKDSYHNNLISTHTADLRYVYLLVKMALIIENSAIYYYHPLLSTVYQQPHVYVLYT